MDLRLAELFAELEVPGGSGEHSRFRVRSIPSAASHYVGRDASGFPCILLRGSGDIVHAPIKLAAIEARFAVPCRVAFADAEERQETLTAVVCISPDPQSQNYFFHVCETIIRIVGPTPSLVQVVEAVQRLIDLFRRLSQPASRSVIGLIGELYIIYRSQSPVMATRAWRSDDYNRFDFAIDDLRLEVKASGDRVRAHNLSAEQCQPPPGTIGILASLFVERSGGGMSLLELIHEVEDRLVNEEELILKIQETVAETLGETLPMALSMRFDERLAKTSLQFYDLTTIPAIRGGIPPEVTQVRFRSDLSRMITVSLTELATENARISDLLLSPL
jgi:hypothetical protein